MNTRDKLTIIFVFLCMEVAIIIVAVSVRDNTKEIEQQEQEIKQLKELAVYNHA